MADPVIRVPNLPMGLMVDKEGLATDGENIFRQALISSLQSNFGNEGLVPPSQTTANIAIIAAHTLPNGEYTCQPGTMIYDTDTDELKVAILVVGVPTFKVIQVV